MKTVLIIVSFCFYLSLLGQNTIPNPNFENWSGGNPIGWQTSNSFTQQFGVTTVSQESTNPFQGNYSIKLETKSVFGYNVAGIITNGQININVNQSPPVTILGGTPFSNRPLRFKGYYKYLPNSSDTSAIAVLLFKYNPSTQKSDTIGFAQHKISEQQTNWTLFDVPITYILSSVPDTIQVIGISSNPYAAVVGSSLFLDSLHFEGGSSDIHFIFNKDMLNTYYDANYKTITIHLPTIYQTSLLLLYNSKGNLINSTTVEKNTTHLTLPAHNIDNGLYILNLIAQKKYSAKILIY